MLTTPSPNVNCVVPQQLPECNFFIKAARSGIERENRNCSQVVGLGDKCTCNRNPTTTIQILIEDKTMLHNPDLRKI